MIRVVLVLQLAVLGLVGWSLFRPSPDQAEAEAFAERARALEAEEAFLPAALAYEHAAALSSGKLALRRAAHRAEALAAIAAADLPGRDAWPRLSALLNELEADPTPESATVAALLKLTLMRARGQRADAAALVGKLIEQGEKSPWFQWHAGALRLEENRVAEARDLLEQLARARPRFGPGMHRLALTYAAEGRFEGAIEALQRAAAGGAGLQAELDLGRLFLKREMWAEGLPHLENALRAPVPGMDLPEILRLVAAAHFHLKRFELAARTYQRAYEIQPEPRTLLSAAIALTAGGQHVQAMQMLEGLAPRANEVPEILFQQAVVAQAINQPHRPFLERYLALARGRDGEAERVKRADEILALKDSPLPKPR